MGAAFIGGLFGCVLLMNLAIPPLVTTRPSMYREIDAGFYQPESWSIATSLIELPWIAVLLLAYSSIVYFMIGLEPSQFGFFYATVFLLGTVFTFLGHTLAAVSNSQQIATAIATVLMGVQALFAGFLVPGPNMADGWIWLHYLVPLRYGLGGLMSTPFYCSDTSGDLPAGEPGPCATVSVIDNGRLVPGKLKADFVDDFFGFKFEDIEFYLGMLAMYIVVLVGVKMLANRFIRHQSR